MTEVLITDICNGIATSLSSAAGLTRIHSFNQLTEGMNDMPTLEVYWERTETDPGGNTDRTTFRAGVRQTELIFYADLYARQRSNLGEDMGALLPLVDAIQKRLEEVCQTKPYFGVAGLKAVRWRGERATFSRGDPLIRYTGARFFIGARVF